MRILVFGDSIAQGFYDFKGGWVQRLANEYHNESLKGMLSTPGYDTTEVFNLGISGDTAQNVLDRIENETAARRWRDDPLIIILAIGTNDARQHNNTVETEVYDFQQILEQLADKAIELADKVLYVGLTAVNEAQTNPWPFSSSMSSWGNNGINLFEDTIKQCAMRKKIPFVPVHDRFIAQLDAGEALLSDGLHPNEAGHQLILELVKPELEKLL